MTAEDHLAIADVLYAYAWHFDHGDPAGVAALFAPDAVVDYGPDVEPIDGRDALAERVGAVLRDVFAATSHHISNVRTEIDEPPVDDRGAGDRRGALGRATAALYAWHRYRDGSPDGHLWGRYDVELRRDDSRWSISRLVLRAAGAVDFHRARMHPLERLTP